eukprot:s16_g28.t1
MPQEQEHQEPLEEDLACLPCLPEMPLQPGRRASESTNRGRTRNWPHRAWSKTTQDHHPALEFPGSDHASRMTSQPHFMLPEPLPGEGER